MRLPWIATGTRWPLHVFAKSRRFLAKDPTRDFKSKLSTFMKAGLEAIIAKN